MKVAAAGPKAAVCVALAPALTVTPPAITFPATPLNFQSPTAVVTVTSTGTALATISSLSTRDIPLSEGSAFEVLDTNCTNQTGKTPVSMVPGASCTATVAMRGFSSPGSTILGALDVFSNVSPSPSVPLSGQVGIDAAIATPLLNFGVLANPGGSLTLPMTFQNTGTVPLAVTDVVLTQFPTVFGVTAGTCPSVPTPATPFTLAPGASCAFGVTFSPEGFPPPGTTPPQSVTGYFQVIYADAANLSATNGTYTVLQGSSTGPGGTVSADQTFIFFQDFPQNVSSSTTVTVTNFASVSQTITIASNTPVITFPNDLCSTAPGGLPPGATCTFDVLLTRASLPAQAYGANITVTGSAAPTSPANIAVSFTVVPGVGFTPATLPFTPFDFGPVAYGQSVVQTFTLTNIDPVPYAFSGSSPAFALFPPYYQAVGGTCEPTATGAAFTLPANGSCTVNIRFAPLVTDGPGPFPTNAYIVAPPPSNKFIDLYLTGSASGPVLSVSPSSFFFGTDNPGVASAPQTFTVTNVGNVAATSVTVTPPVVTPPNLADFVILNDNCTPGAGLTVNGTCTFDVKFLRANPGLASGFNSGDVTLTTTPALATALVSVSGYAVAVTPTPGQLEYFYAPSIAAPLAFPATVVSQSSAPIDITIGNTGGTALGISSIVSSSPEFAFTTACPASPATLSAGGCCTLTVTFMPSAVGTRAGTITITPAVGPPTLIALTGVATSPTAPGIVKSFSPNPIQVGGVSTLGITITNPNAFPLTNASFTDNFPAGLVVASTPALTNTCGGTATATAGSAALSLGGGTIAAASTLPGTCSVTVQVTAAAASTGLANTIPPGAATGGFKTTESTAAPSATATLVVTTVPLPSVVLAPPSLGFGTQTVFVPTAPQTVAVRNVGTAPLNVSGFAVSGDFSATTACPGFPVPPGGQCTIDAKFTPLLAGLRTGQIAITSDAPGSPHIVALSGTGVVPLSPNASLSASTLSFPATTAGQVSAGQVVTLTNTGAGVLSILALDVVGTGFAASSNCGTAVASLASCQITVVFSPPVAGSYGASLRVATNAPGSPNFVNLSGTSIPAPAGRLSAPASLSFTDQIIGTSSASQTFSITNAGNATATVRRITVTGDYALAGNCFDLRVGESCTFSMTFTPTVIGVRSGQILVESDASNPVFAIALNGRGVPIPAPQITLSATSFGFGNAALGAAPLQPLSITNSGTADLRVASIIATGDFRVKGSCPAVMAPGTVCRVEVSFVPSIPGTRSGELRIFSNVADSPTIATLAGQGCRLFSLNDSRTSTLSCNP